MKTITALERELILDATGEGLTPLPAGVLEKDLLITDILSSIASAEWNGLTLIFCGGTCLSKAHHLIKRMSEDIDFKISMPEGLSRNARSNHLHKFKISMAAMLRERGFYLPDEEIAARNENGYIGMNLHYQSQFSPVVSLRPDIKVEFNAISPLLSTHKLPVCSILGALVNPDIKGFEVVCVGVREALVEKTVSFLRRTAEKLANRHRTTPDDRLIRHIYDVFAIVKYHPDVLNDLPYLQFRSTVLADAAQYRNQFPEFEQDPIAQMRGALTALQVDPGFEQEYTSFVEELVFEGTMCYPEVLANFIELTENFLSNSFVYDLTTEQEGIPE